MALSEMVERVARAICWKNGMNPDLTLGGDGENFLWHEYESQARAAIEAMRQLPSSISDEPLQLVLMDPDTPVPSISWIWNRVIDKALDDG